MPQPHKDGQREKGRGGGLREKDVREKDTDSNTEHLSPITCLKLLRLLRLLLFGRSTVSGIGPEGLGIVSSRRERPLLLQRGCRFQKPKSAKRGNGNVLNVGLTGSFPHLSITG